MPKSPKFYVTLVCLVCVVVICVAPDLDLPDTVLLSNQLASLLLLAIAGLAAIGRRSLVDLARLPNIALSPSQAFDFERFLPKPSRECVFLC